VTDQKHSIGELLALIHALLRIIVRRLAKLNVHFFSISQNHDINSPHSKSQHSCWMTFAILPVYNNPAQADTPQICVVASNGKTACGTLKAVERACVTTNAGGVVCGKFKSAREEQEPRQEEAKNPAPIAGYRKELDGAIFLLKSCRRVDL
jgi:hypothetical protein